MKEDSRLMHDCDKRISLVGSNFYYLLSQVIHKIYNLIL